MQTSGLLSQLECNYSRKCCLHGRDVWTQKFLDSHGSCNDNVYPGRRSIKACWVLSQIVRYGAKQRPNPLREIQSARFASCKLVNSVVASQVQTAKWTLAQQTAKRVFRARSQVNLHYLLQLAFRVSSWLAKPTLNHAQSLEWKWQRFDSETCLLGV